MGPTTKKYLPFLFLPLATNPCPALTWLPTSGPQPSLRSKHTHRSQPKRQIRPQPEFHTTCLSAPPPPQLSTRQSKPNPHPPTCTHQTLNPNHPQTFTLGSKSRSNPIPKSSPTLPRPNHSSDLKSTPFHPQPAPASGTPRARRTLLRSTAQSASRIPRRTPNQVRYR